MFTNQPIVSAAHQKLATCYNSFKEILDKKAPGFTPKVAAVLGSGLGKFAEIIEVKAVVDFTEIQDFPKATAPGHEGRFVLGTVSGVPVVVMQGRLHYYEGYTMDDVVLPIRLMGLLGAGDVILTCAVGAIDFVLTPGDFVLIRDHISTFIPSPLIGPNIPFGDRFPAMNKVYDPDLFASVKEAALDEGIVLKDEIYIQFPGPQYETPAEVRMARALGAGVVGMSTACEAIAASHMGMKVCGIACVTNLASGMTEIPPSHDEVEIIAAKSENAFSRLLSAAIFAVANVRKYVYTEEELMMPHI